MRLTHWLDRLFLRNPRSFGNSRRRVRKTRPTRGSIERLEIRSLPSATSPVLASVGLTNDTGTPNDLATSDPRLSIVVTDSTTPSGKSSYVVQFDYNSDGKSDQTGYVSLNTPFVFNPTNGISAGPVIIRMRAGEEFEADYGDWQAFSFVYQPPAVSVALFNDTGTPGDKVTADARLSGSVVYDGSFTQVQVELDLDGNGKIDQSIAPAADGSYLLQAMPAFLSPGPVAARVRAVDYADAMAPRVGAWQTLNFEYQPPSPTVVNIAILNDTGTPGDDITADPTLTGQVDYSGGPIGQLQIEADWNGDGMTDQSVMAGPTGAWTISPWSAFLSPGTRTVRLRAVDMSMPAMPRYGQWQSKTYTYQPPTPTLGPLSLVNDTGTPGDLISSDIRVQGQAAYPGGTLAGVQIEVDLRSDGMTEQWIAVGAGGAFSIDLAPFTNGMAGPYSLRMRAVDNSMPAQPRYSEWSTLNFTYQPPTPAFVTLGLQNDTDIPNDNITTDPTISGQIAYPGGTPADVRIEVDLNGHGMAELWKQANADGTFSLNLSSILMGRTGTLVPMFRAVDYSNPMMPRASAWQAFTFQYQPPPEALPIVGGLALVNDTGMPGDNVTSDPRIAGTVTYTGSMGQVQVELDLNGDGVVDSTATPSPMGMFQLNPSAASVPVGSVSARVRAVDFISPMQQIVGQWQTLDFTYQPPLPTLSGIALVNDTGMPGDDVTTDPRLTGSFQYSGSASGQWTIEADWNGDGIVDQSQNVGPAGVWTIEPGPAWQTTGTINARLRAVVLSTPLMTVYGAWQTKTFTLQSSQASAPTVGNLALVNDTGMPGDNVTSDPRLSGMVNYSGSMGQVQVQLDLNGDGMVDSTAIPSPMGMFQLNPSAASVPVGSVSARVRAVDFAGATPNVGAWQTLNFTFQPPLPTLSGIALVNDTGMPGDDVTTDARLTGAFQYEGSASGQWTIEADWNGDGIVDQSQNVGPAGVWTIEPGPAWLTAGTINARLRAVVLSTPLMTVYGTWQTKTFTLQSASPPPVVESVALANDTGAPDGVTSDPTVAGQISFAGGSFANVRVEIDLGQDGSIQKTVTVSSGGSFSATLSEFLGASPGPVALRVRAVDVTNPATPIVGSWVNFSFTYEPVVPVVSTLALANDTGTPGDGVTSDATLEGVVVYNGGSLEHVSVQIDVFGDGSIEQTVNVDANGEFTFDPAAWFNDSAGSKTIRVRAVDGSGAGPAIMGAWRTLQFSWVPPAPAAVSLHLVNDTGDPDDLVTGDPRIAGDVDWPAPGGLPIQFDVDNDGVADGTATTNALGEFVVDLSQLNLSNGQKTVRIRAGRMNAMQTGTVYGEWSSFTYTYQAVPAEAPAVEGLELINDTGTVGDLETYDARLTGQLVRSIGSVSRVQVDVDLDGDGVADGIVFTADDGTFEIDPADWLELTEGELEIQVRGVVSAGSAGRVAGEWESIQIQVVAAPVETLTLGNLHLAVDTGAPGDGATSVPQIAGTVLGAFSNEQLGVEYDVNGDGFADGSVAAELDGTFVIDLRNHSLPFGPVTVALRANRADAESADWIEGGWQTFSFVLEPIPFSPAEIDSLALSEDTDTPDDLITSNATLEGVATTALGVAAETLIEYDLNGDGVVDGSTMTDADGHFTLDLDETTLPNGSLTVRVRAASQDPNSGVMIFSDWSALTFTFADAPAGWLPAIEGLHLVRDTGTDGDGITRDPRIAGVIARPGGSLGNVPIYYDVDGDGRSDGVVTTASDGGFIISPRRSLAAGPVSVELWSSLWNGVLQRQVRSESAEFSFTFEAGGLPPATLSQLTLANDTGVPGDLVTADPTLSGVATREDGSSDGLIVEYTRTPPTPGFDPLATPVDVNADGTFEFTLTGAAPNGSVVVYVRTVDWDDVQSRYVTGAWQSLTFQWVGSDPTAASVVTGLHLVSDTGTPGDGVTADARIAGTIQVGGAAITADAPVQYDLNQDGTVDGIVTADGATGDFLVDLNHASLSAGAKSIRFRAGAASGSQYVYGDWVEFSFTFTPTASAGLPVVGGLHLVDDTGVAGNGVTSRPVIGGTVTVGTPGTSPLPVQFDLDGDGNSDGNVWTSVTNSGSFEADLTGLVSPDRFVNVRFRAGTPDAGTGAYVYGNWTSFSFEYRSDDEGADPPLTLPTGPIATVPDLTALDPGDLTPAVLYSGVPVPSTGVVAPGAIAALADWDEPPTTAGLWDVPSAEVHTTSGVDELGGEWTVDTNITSSLHTEIILNANGSWTVYRLYQSTYTISMDYERDDELEWERTQSGWRSWSVLIVGGMNSVTYTYGEARHDQVDFDRTTTVAGQSGGSTSTTVRRSLGRGQTISASGSKEIDTQGVEIIQESVSSQAGTFLPSFSLGTVYGYFLVQPGQPQGSNNLPALVDDTYSISTTASPVTEAGSSNSLSVANWSRRSVDGVVTGDSSLITDAASKSTVTSPGATSSSTTTTEQKSHSSSTTETNASQQSQIDSIWSSDKTVVSRSAANNGSSYSETIASKTASGEHHTQFGGTWASFSRIEDAVQSTSGFRNEAGGSTTSTGALLNGTTTSTRTWTDIDESASATRSSKGEYREDSSTGAWTVTTWNNSLADTVEYTFEQVTDSMQASGTGLLASSTSAQTIEKTRTATVVSSDVKQTRSDGTVATSKSNNSFESHTADWSVVDNGSIDATDSSRPGVTVKVHSTRDSKDAGHVQMTFSSNRVEGKGQLIAVGPGENSSTSFKVKRTGSGGPTTVTLTAKANEATRTVSSGATSSWNIDDDTTLSLNVSPQAGVVAVIESKNRSGNHGSGSNSAFLTETTVYDEMGGSTYTASGDSASNYSGTYNWSNSASTDTNGRQTSTDGSSSTFSQNTGSEETGNGLYSGGSLGKGTVQGGVTTASFSTWSSDSGSALFKGQSGQKSVSKSLGGGSHSESDSSYDGTRNYSSSAGSEETVSPGGSSSHFWSKSSSSSIGKNSWTQGSGSSSQGTRTDPDRPSVVVTHKNSSTSSSSGSGNFSSTSKASSDTLNGVTSSSSDSTSDDSGSFQSKSSSNGFSDTTDRSLSGSGYSRSSVSHTSTSKSEEEGNYSTHKESHSASGPGVASSSSLSDYGRSSDGSSEYSTTTTTSSVNLSSLDSTPAAPPMAGGDGSLFNSQGNGLSRSSSTSKKDGSTKFTTSSGGFDNTVNGVHTTHDESTSDSKGKYTIANKSDSSSSLTDTSTKGVTRKTESESESKHDGMGTTTDHSFSSVDLLASGAKLNVSESSSTVSETGKTSSTSKSKAREEVEDDFTTSGLSISSDFTTTSSDSRKADYTLGTEAKAASVNMISESFSSSSYMEDGTVDEENSSTVGHRIVTDTRESGHTKTLYRDEDTTLEGSGTYRTERSESTTTSTFGGTHVKSHESSEVDSDGTRNSDTSIYASDDYSSTSGNVSTTSFSSSYEHNVDKGDYGSGSLDITDVNMDKAGTYTYHFEYASSIGDTTFDSTEDDWSKTVTSPAKDAKDQKTRTQSSTRNVTRDGSGSYDSNSSSSFEILTDGKRLETFSSESSSDSSGKITTTSGSSGKVEGHDQPDEINRPRHVTSSSFSKVTRKGDFTQHAESKSERDDNTGSTATKSSSSSTYTDKGKTESHSGSNETIDYQNVVFNVDYDTSGGSTSKRDGEGTYEVSSTSKTNSETKLNVSKYTDSESGTYTYKSDSHQTTTANGQQAYTPQPQINVDNTSKGKDSGKGTSSSFYSESTNDGAKSVTSWSTDKGEGTSTASETSKSTSKVGPSTKYENTDSKITSKYDYGSDSESSSWTSDNTSSSKFSQYRNETTTTKWDDSSGTRDSYKSGNREHSSDKGSGDEGESTVVSIGNSGNSRERGKIESVVYGESEVTITTKGTAKEWSNSTWKDGDQPPQDPFTSTNTTPFGTVKEYLESSTTSGSTDKYSSTIKARTFRLANGTLDTTGTFTSESVKTKFTTKSKSLIHYENLETIHVPDLYITFREAQDSQTYGTRESSTTTTKSKGTLADDSPATTTSTTLFNNDFTEFSNTTHTDVYDYRETDVERISTTKSKSSVRLENKTPLAGLQLVSPFKTQIRKSETDTTLKIDGPTSDTDASSHSESKTVITDKYTRPEGLREAREHTTSKSKSSTKTIEQIGGGTRTRTITSEGESENDRKITDRSDGTGTVTEFSTSESKSNDLDESNWTSSKGEGHSKDEKTWTWKSDRNRSFDLTLQAATLRTHTASDSMENDHKLTSHSEFSEEMPSFTMSSKNDRTLREYQKTTNEESLEGAMIRVSTSTRVTYDLDEVNEMDNGAGPVVTEQHIHRIDADGTPVSKLGSPYVPERYVLTTVNFTTMEATPREIEGKMKQFLQERAEQNPPAPPAAGPEGTVIFSFLGFTVVDVGPPITDGYTNRFNEWIGEGLVRPTFGDERLIRPGGLKDDLLLTALLVTEITGYVDPTPLSDILNGSLNLAEGNYADAAMSFAGALMPGGGDKAGKAAGKAGKGVFEGLGGAAKNLGAKIGDVKDTLVCKFITGECFVEGTPVLVHPEGSTGSWMGAAFGVALVGGGLTVALSDTPKKQRRGILPPPRDRLRDPWKTGAGPDHDDRTIEPDSSDALGSLSASDWDALGAGIPGDAWEPSSDSEPISSWRQSPSRGVSPCGTTVLRQVVARRHLRQSELGEANRPVSTPLSTSVSPRIQPRRALRWTGIGLLLFAPLLALFGLASSIPTTRTIDQIQVGQAVIADNPELDDNEAPDPLTIDHPSQWRRYVLRLDKPDGEAVDIVLLKPVEWLEDNSDDGGRTVELDLAEFGAIGQARVLDVGPCPPIDQLDSGLPARDSGGRPQQRRLVTATFRHTSRKVLNLEIEGEPAPLGVTASHPFWSEDRQQFIAAGELRPGERLAGSRGEALRVRGITARSGALTVFNLEVDGEHVFFVGANGILVHNKCLNKAIGDIGERKVARDLKKNGWEVLGPIERKGSGHGVDLVARKQLKDGSYAYKVAEVKVNGSRLNPDQALGGESFVANRIKRSIDESWKFSKKAGSKIRDELRQAIADGAPIEYVLMKVKVNKKTRRVNGKVLEIPWTPS